MRLSPGGTGNGEGGEGPLAEDAAGEPMAPTRSWVKEPWKAGEGMSGKSAAARVRGPGLDSAAEPAAAKKDSAAARGGRESAGRGGGRRAPSPPLAEASCAAMGVEVGRNGGGAPAEGLFRGLCGGTKHTASSRRRKRAAARRAEAGSEKEKIGRAHV